MSATRKIARIVTAAKSTARYCMGWLSEQPDVDYWSETTPANAFADYARAWQRSAFLLGIVTDYLEKSSRILELGCNVGRNLEALRLAGYSHLTGVDISSHALKMAPKFFPGLNAVGATLACYSIEELLHRMYKGDDTYDLVFTMAVLEHVPHSSDSLLQQLPKIARYIIVIEDEVQVGLRHYVRDYATFFNGAKQVKQLSCSHVPGLGHSFVARVLQSEEART